MPVWRSSDTQLLQALPGALGRLQRRHCEMLEDCLLLVLKLVRCQMRPQTNRRDADTARNLHTAASEGHSSGSAEDIQAAAASAASIRLSGAGTGRHGAQSSSHQQDGVRRAASCAEGEFLESFAAYVSALPEVVQAWPEATRGRAAAMLQCFLARCCACTAEMHIAAEASVLSRLAPHQQRAIFGGGPLEDDMTAAAQQLLADAAAAMCSAGIKIGDTSTSDEQGLVAGALWQAEEVALGIELLRHAALLRGNVAAALQWPADPAELLPQSAHSTPFLLDAAGRIRVRPDLQLVSFLVRLLSGHAEEQPPGINFHLLRLCAGLL